MTRPDFNTLEAMVGRPDIRLVNGAWMDREEYETCGWHVVGQHPDPNGVIVFDWKAELAGLQKWGRLQGQRREDRKRSWSERNEADEESDEYYRNLGGRKP
jgi:hypothetical protein